MSSNVRSESWHLNVLRIHYPFCGVPESPRDVVFLVKQYIGSEVLTQPPEICFRSPVSNTCRKRNSPYRLEKCFPESCCRDGSVRTS